MILDCSLRITILYIYFEKFVTLVTHSKIRMSVGKSTPQWPLRVRIHFLLFGKTCLTPRQERWRLNVLREVQPGITREATRKRSYEREAYFISTLIILRRPPRMRSQQT